MAEFGLPIRNATTDANEGVVNTPSKKHSTRQTATKQKSMTSLDEGVQSFGQSMGKALAGKLTQEASNLNEQRATDAAIRQGQDHAINQIDANKKRTGWEKAIFGENIDYRVAQQRAAQNVVNAQYLEQATTIDQYAGESPDDYSNRLKEGLDKALEPYAEDKETKRLVTEAWLVKSSKLAAKQAESHYAWNQQQQRDTYAKQVEQTFDTWSVEAAGASTPEEARALIDSSAKFFNKATKPQGMSDIAWKSVVNDGVMNSLRSGNIGAYNAAKANGWITNLTAPEKVSMDRAIDAYDTDFSQKAQTLYQEAELASLQATTLDEAAAQYQVLLGQIDTISSRSSGTERANLAIARQRTNAQKGITSIDKAKAQAKKEAERIAKAAAKLATEKEEELKFNNNLQEALRVQDPINRAGLIEQLDPKRSELQENLDVTLVEDVTKIVGSDALLTESEAVNAIMQDPKVAKTIAARVKTAPVESPLVKRTLETFINGWTTLLDDNNRLNERGVVAMQSVAQFAANEESFKSVVGTTNFDNYEIIRRGLAIGQTSEMINRDIAAYQDGKDNRGKYAINWELGEGESKRDRVSSLVKRYTGQVPQGGSLASYMEDYDRALTIYKGDRRLAEQYIRTSALDAAINYKGRVLPNSKHLNDVSPDYNFEQLMDGAQKVSGDSASLLTPYLSSLGVNLRDKDGKILTSIDQVDNLSIYTTDGIDGFYIDSPQSQSPIRITSDVMKHWGTVLEQRNNFKKLNAKMSDEQADAWFKEQEELQSTNIPHLQ